MTGDKNKESSNVSPEIDDYFDSDLYANVARRARLRELNLVSSHYEIKLECFLQAENSDGELKYGFSGRLGNLSFDSEDGVIIGSYLWQVEVKHKRKKALKLNAEYLLLYTELEGCDEKYVSTYFDKIARFTTYPYFRALFSLNTSTSGVSLNPLPSLIDRVD